MPESFNSRSEASKRGWAKRKADPYYYSSEAVQKRSEASRKAAETRRKNKQEEIKDESDVIMDTINEIIDTLMSYTPASNLSPKLQEIKINDASTISNILDGAIERDGLETVARRCEENASVILDLLNDLLFASGTKSNEIGREGFQMKMNEIARIINGSAITIDESSKLTDENEALYDIDFDFDELEDDEY